MKDPSSELTRIRLDLEEFDFRVEYLRGKNNFVADALSRITIADLTNIEINNLKIFKMITRSSKQNNTETFQNESQQKY